MGTINGGEGDSRAIVLDKSNNKQELYEKGDVIQGAKIKEILRGKVILVYNGKDEMLDMSEAAKERSSLSAGARLPVLQLPGLIRSQTHCTVLRFPQRGHPEGSLTDLDLISAVSNNTEKMSKKDNNYGNEGELYMRMSKRSLMSTVIFGLLLVFTVAFPAEELPQPISATEQSGQRFITIDFDNVDIQLFIKYISELTGKNFVVDKAVQGNVTILSPTKISEEEAYKVFESVLEVHGFTTVDAGPVIKILPAARARSQNVQLFD